MESQEVLEECKKIWASDPSARTDIDKFENLNAAYEEISKDFFTAIELFNKGKSNANKLIKEYYDEAMKCLKEMKNIAKKHNNKKLIDYVETKANVLDDYRKRYIG